MKKRTPAPRKFVDHRRVVDVMSRWWGNFECDVRNIFGFEFHQFGRFRVRFRDPCSESFKFLFSRCRQLQNKPPQFILSSTFLTSIVSDKMQAFSKCARPLMQAAVRRQGYSTATSAYAATAENLRITKDTKVIYQGFTGKQGR
jgi:hypothetical protein